MRSVLGIAVLGMTMLAATVVVAIGLIGLEVKELKNDLATVLVLFTGLWLYWALGALIVVRANGHTVGWLFALAATLMATMFACFSLGWMLALIQHPLGPWLSLAGSLLFPPATSLFLPAVALTFPTGTLPGPRWRLAVRILAATVVVGMISPAIRPGPMGAGPVNPLTPWIPAYPPNVLEALGALDAIGNLSLPLGSVLGMAAIIIRFRRSDGDERQQLKWFFAAIVPGLVMISLSFSEFAEAFPLINAVSVATLPIIPVSIAIAILRYRLYDIDRFISRSISYGLVTALLVMVFLLVNLGLQWLLSSVTSGNSLAVAGSTLLAAALFTPVRLRVQRVVDRRFDRARYDGERTASAFSIRMREATDLPTVAADLGLTVRRAIAPSRVGLWLREGGR